jgi:hypothetical protein
MREEVAIVGLGLYGATAALVVGLLVWLYSYRCCSEWNSHARRLPCFSPKNLFFFIIFSFLLCTQCQPPPSLFHLLRPSCITFPLHSILCSLFWCY